MRSIAIDLQSEAGKAIFRDLVATADVVIDNYRPGVLQRLGIDYDALSAVNPQIISLSITGFGEGGPLAAQPGFDPILQGMSGMMTAQGGDSEPVFLTVAVNDVTAGAMSVLGTGLALYHRAVRAAGQRVWTSLDRMSAFMQSGELTRFDGRPPARTGGADFRGPGALDRLYEARDGWVRLQARPGDLDALRSLGLLPEPSGGAGRRRRGPGQPARRRLRGQQPRRHHPPPDRGRRARHAGPADSRAGRTRRRTATGCCTSISAPAASPTTCRAGWPGSPGPSRTPR